MQGLRSRTRTGRGTKDWTRCLLIQREGLHPFNASDISWLERRLIDVLLEAPQIDLVNKTPPPLELVPDYKAEILERTVVAALGLLAVLGAYVVYRPLPSKADGWRPFQPLGHPDAPIDSGLPCAVRARCHHAQRIGTCASCETGGW